MNLSPPVRAIATPFDRLDVPADDPLVAIAIDVAAAAAADAFALAPLESFDGGADLRAFGTDLSDLRGAWAKPDHAASGKGGNGGGNGGGKGGKPKDPTDPTDPTDPPDPGVLTSYTSGGAASSSYNVKIDFSGTWTTALQDAFVKAADFLSKLVLGDLPDYISNGVRIDDLTISATLSDIDGTGGVLGRAGPTSARTDTWLPGTGVMEFDIADAASYDARGLFDDIVLHEMMHCMGVGTLWGSSYMGLTAGSISRGDIRFTGTNANAVYERDFAAIDAADGFDFGIKIEEDGGSGTAGGHWDEDTFDNEIMTGFINDANYLSEMTIAALEDMGYDTVFDDITRSDDLVGATPADPLNLLG